jgi:hypothetical protein
LGYFNPEDVFDFGTLSSSSQSFSFSSHLHAIASNDSLYKFNGKNTLGLSYDNSSSPLMVSCLGEDRSLSLLEIDPVSNTYSCKSENLNVSQLNYLSSEFWNQDKLTVCGHSVNIDMLDLATQKSCWKSKSSKRDELNLIVPIKFRNMAMDPVNDCMYVASDSRVIEVYSPKTQKKPISNWEVKDGEDVRLDKVILDKTGDYLFVSDVFGSLLMYDRRKPGLIAKRIKDSLACFSSLLMSSDGKNLITTGLDRYIRCYSFNNGVLNLSAEEYLKTKLYSSYCLDTLEIETEIRPFKDRMTTKVEEIVEEDVNNNRDIKDKFDIEEVFYTRKEQVHSKLRKRIKKQVSEIMKVPKKHKENS